MKRNIFEIALLAIALAVAPQVQTQEVVGWPSADVLTRYGLDGITQPAGTRANYKIESPTSITIRLENATEANAVAVVAQIQKIPNIMAPLMFEDSFNEGAIEGRFILGIENDRGREYDVKYYPNQKTFAIYIRVLRF